MECRADTMPLWSKYHELFFMKQPYFLSKKEKKCMSLPSTLKCNANLKKTNEIYLQKSYKRINFWTNFNQKGHQIYYFRSVTLIRLKTPFSFLINCVQSYRNILKFWDFLKTKNPYNLLGQLQKNVTQGRINREISQYSELPVVIY